MTNKQTLIIEYLKQHDGQSFYIVIRDGLGSRFKDEKDFDTTLSQLVGQNLVYENDNDTLYKLT